MKIFEKIKERSNERKTGVKKERKKSFRRLEKERIEAEIMTLYDNLRTETPGSENYDAIVKEIEQLKGTQTKKVKDWGPIIAACIAAAVSAFEFAKLLKFEQNGVIKSGRAFSWIHKPKI